MKCYMKTLFLHGQERTLAERGDDIWEGICDIVPTQSPIFLRELVGKIPIIAHLSASTQTQLLRLVLRNVIEEYHDREDLQNCPIRKLGIRYYMNGAVE